METPSLPHGEVVIASEPRGRPVSVDVRRGTGRVSDPKHICTLFPQGPPVQEGAWWGGVLWGCTGKAFAPFPVSVPLIRADDGTPDIALLDIVYEELGMWPIQHDRGSEADGADAEKHESEGEDEDVRALAEAKHEGQLDRFAACISVLRKRIKRAESGTDYARARLGMIRAQLEKLEVPAHVRKVLLDYLRLPRRAKRGGE